MRSVSRQRRGFQRAGALPADRLGLSERRTRDLMLAQAWSDAAGARLAAQAEVEVRRGVLEIVAGDRAWLTALEPLAARLAARVAAACPQLKIGKYRLSARGAERGDPEPVPADVPESGDGAARPGAATGDAPVEPVDDDRLRRLAARYLDRQKP